MADSEETLKVNSPFSETLIPPSPSLWNLAAILFLEVICKSSGKIRRFAAGTDARFALSLINRKLDVDAPLARHIEAVKEGEEPVSFGPSAVLVDYGTGWKLQTVTEVPGIRSEKRIRPRLISSPPEKIFDDLDQKETSIVPPFTFQYLGKILLAFAFLFLLGAVFTIALESLPRFILFVNTLIDTYTV